MKKKSDASPVLTEAKRLWDLGWHVHWIRPNSKAPVRSGWSKGERESWEQLAKTYQLGMGLGVRMGTKVDGGYLANIDVDVKSGKARHYLEALEKLKSIYGGIYDVSPRVGTGYGMRLFVLTKEPVQSGKLGASHQQVRVKMPTAPVTAQQKKSLTAEELAQGWRFRPAWELELMSEGRQVVLPPSVHPDTGKAYAWAKDAEHHSMPVLPTAAAGAVAKKEKASSEKIPEPVDVDLMTDNRLPVEVVDMITGGEGAGDDRSAAAYRAAAAMIRAGFTDGEVVGVLTDRGTYLGEVAYDHRQTDDRRQAAEWAYKYCLVKAKAERASFEAFTAEVNAAVPPMGPEAVQRAENRVRRDMEAVPWRQRLQRSGKDGEGGVKPSIQNMVDIITNVVGGDALKFNLFTMQEIYGRKCPWATRGKAGDTLHDGDIVDMKVWFSRKWGFEPSTGAVFDVVTHLARLNQFHPVREWLDSLEWDGVPRVDGWLKRHFNAKGDHNYLAQVLRKWMVASITRVFNPGAKFDWLPIFEGVQGAGKSTFGAILFGQEYFLDSLPNLNDKDSALNLSGILCVEFGELESLRKNELETIKAFITRQVDKVRPPYGRKRVELPRQVVFLGTTDKEAYLKDDAGNRRFMPVKVGDLDFDQLHRDREQLWAEAYCLYANGWEETLYLEGDARAVAKAIQQDKMVTDEATWMAEALSEFIDAERKKPEKERFDFSRFLLSTLFSKMGPLDKWKGDNRDLQFAAKALRRLPGTSAVQRRTETARYWSLAFNDGDDGL